MIRFRDFVPTLLERASLDGPARYEPFSQAVEMMNNWVSANDIDVVTVETVVLPNMHRPQAGGPDTASLESVPQYATTWHQFVRVWYRWDE